MGMGIYSKMFPVDLATLDLLRDGFCSNCSEHKFTHHGPEGECTPTCIFCEDACVECQAPLF